MSAQMDVLARAVERLRVPHPDHAQDAANNEAAIALHEYSAAVAELIGFVQDCADGRPEAEPSECRKRAIDLLARIGGSK